MNEATLVISLVSALMAVGSLILSIVALTKDSPKLKIKPEFGISLHEPAELKINVGNVGKRTTTLVKLGYRLEHTGKMVVKDRRKDDGTEIEVDFESTIPMIKDSFVLQPGESKTFGITIRQWPHLLVRADMYLRPFATDSHGKTIWGRSEPYLRMMIKAGWKVPVGTNPNYLEKSEKPFKSVPIYPKWMIWKKDYLRK